MRKSYEEGVQPDKAGLRELLATDGREHLVPLVNVFALAGGALDQIIDVIGRAAIEAVLEISAAEVAGQRQPGKRRNTGDAAYHGREGGRVYLADRAVRVEKPRLRSPGGEVEIPAYETLRRPSGLGERMLELLLVGLGTRSYGKVVGELAETAGVSKSSVSRYAAAAAGERLEGAGGAAAGRPGLSDRLRGRHSVRGPSRAGSAGRGRRWQQADPGAPGGCQRERRRRARAAREPRRARPGPREGRPRRLEGATRGRRPGLRERLPGAALPETQDAQCDRPSAQGTPRSGPIGA